MLYLIKCNNLIKIGYTTNLHRRIQAYKVTNSFVEFLELAEGQRTDESELHSRLKDYRYEKSREWFIDCSEVREIWNTYRVGREISNIEIVKATPRKHRIDKEWIRDLGEDIIYNREIINIETEEIYPNIPEWLDAEDLSQYSIYDLFEKKSKFRFKNPKGIMYHYGDGEPFPLEELYKPDIDPLVKTELDIQDIISVLTPEQQELIMQKQRMREIIL